jgi:hypothetical protein
LPIAIVAASVGAAAMGWQASVADERATVKDEASRQDLVSQQQAHIQAVQAVGADLRLYGEVERYRIRYEGLQDDAKRVAIAERGELARAAAADRAVTKSLESQLQFPEALGANGPYDSQLARVQAETRDLHLASLEPKHLHAEATLQRDRGLHLVGLAVLFIVALFCFTCAEVTDVARPTRPQDAGTADASVAVGRSAATERACHAFALSGLLVSAAALVLFVIVRML